VSPTLLSRNEPAVTLFIYGAESYNEFQQVFNGHFADLGTFLTIAGFVLVQLLTINMKKRIYS
jgi:hypothetical protein